MTAVAPNWETLPLKSVLGHCSREILRLLCPWKMWNLTADLNTCCCWQSIKFPLRKGLCVLVQIKWIFPVCWPTTSRVLRRQFRKMLYSPLIATLVLVSGPRECIHISFLPDILPFLSLFLPALYFYFFPHLFTNGTMHFKTRPVVVLGSWKYTGCEFQKSGSKPTSVSS